MKITYKATITITDIVPDTDGSKLMPVENVTQAIIDELRLGLSDDGTVDVSDIEWHIK